MYNFYSINLTLISTTLAMLSAIFGSSLVLFSKNKLNKKYYKIFLGFTSGMMISSSILSLLIPSFNLLNNHNDIYYIIIGLIIGSFSLKSIDQLISLIIYKNNLNIKLSLKRKYLIIFSSSFRNLIEGISIGIAFSLITLQSLDNTLSSAIILSASMILQNIPEGFSLSMPLKNENISSYKSFFLGSIPGFFEPIGGIIGIILSNKIIKILPFILSIAAGSIITVVYSELIPEYSKGKFKKYGTIGFILGFVLLLILEIIFK